MQYLLGLLAIIVVGFLLINAALEPVGGIAGLLYQLTHIFP